MKVIIMYRTAIYASKKDRIDIVNSFNFGKHVIDEENDINSYSILN